MTQQALLIEGCSNLTNDVIMAAIPENKKQYIDLIVHLDNDDVYVLLKSLTPTTFKSFPIDTLIPFQRGIELPMVTMHHFGHTNHPSRRYNPFTIHDKLPAPHPSATSKMSNQAPKSSNTGQWGVASKSNKPK
jgi:hypothetical protein